MLEINKIQKDPDELTQLFLELYENLRERGGKSMQGVWQTRRAIENGRAKLVYINGDREVPDEVLHLKILCEKYGKPYVALPPGYDGIPDSAVIIRYGRSKRLFETLIQRLEITRTLNCLLQIEDST